jgi:acetyl/propionyl-CoA carboxylase alpha subunit
MIERLLIANRAEIACRVIRSAQAMGVHTVALYSDPDAHAPHVAAADEAIALPGATAAETYLNSEAVIAAAVRAGADAIHPGYGFLSENAAFARACDDAGIVFVGPTPDVIAAMGDKIAAKATMRAVGVPVLPDAEVTNYPWAAADTIGFPLLVKAAAGGGGKGMRLVDRAEDIADAVAAARREAGAAFGDDRVFLERFVTPARHVEVQILGDAHGTVVHLGERECSVQRRHQKIIEESPSAAVDDALRTRMTDAAVAAAQELGYRNAGTVEFVLGPDGKFFFLEVNTRLQVEHPVTELAWRLRDGTALDLVRLQLMVAAREPLPFAQGDLVPAGHAIEARVYAEDVPAGFLPATGTLRTWSIPRLPGVRVDEGVTTGSAVTVHYDPMLAKVIASAPTRAEAIAVLTRALRHSRIHGVTTNRDFLVRALQHPGFRSGDYTTDLVTEHLDPQSRGAEQDATDRVHAAAAALVQARANQLAAPVPTLPPGWRNSRSAPHRVTYQLRDLELSVAYTPQRGGTWTVDVGEQKSMQVRVHGWPDQRADGVMDLEVDGRRLRVAVTVVGDHVDVDSPLGHTPLLRQPLFPDIAADEAAGGLRAPMPGSVVSVHAEVGQSVTRGDLLVILEAMKMEHRVTAPHDGEIAELRVAAGDAVNTDDVLVVLNDPA